MAPEEAEEAATAAAAAAVAMTAEAAMVVVTTVVAMVEATMEMARPYATSRAPRRSRCLLRLEALAAARAECARTSHYKNVRHRIEVPYPGILSAHAHTAITRCGERAARGCEPLRRVWRDGALHPLGEAAHHHRRTATRARSRRKSHALACYRTAQIYNRQGVPLFYREWSRPVAVKDMREEHKLMFGFLFSLKQLVGKMSPRR